MASEKIEWISKAKGLAILGVVAVHVIANFQTLSDYTQISAALYKIAAHGGYGVQIFYVISAFLAFRSLDKRDGLKWSKKEYFVYLANKAARLMPVLYITALLYLIKRIVEIHGFPGVTDSVWRQGFFSVTFLNGLSPHYYNPYGNWYVGTLFLFIAMAPFLKAKIDSLNKASAFFIFSIVLNCALMFILGKINAELPSRFYFFCWLPRQLPTMSLGICLYLFFSSETKTGAKLFAATISLFFLLEIIFGKSPMEPHVKMAFILTVFSIAVFDNKRKFFSWLKILGDNSYGIYLYHIFLMHVFENQITNLGKSGKPLAACLAVYVALIAASLAASIVTHNFVEKPFSAFTKKKLSAQYPLHKSIYAKDI